MKKFFIFIIIFILVLFSKVWSYDVTVRVGLHMNQKSINISCKKPLFVKDAHTLKEICKSNSRVLIKAVNGKIFVQGKKIDASYLYVNTVNYRYPIKINKVPYRGYYLVGLNEKGRLFTVNYVGLEDYLAGVLGGEISCSWPVEAIKAQAVSARTYVLNRMRVKKKALYDVCNDTRDQMYIGYRGESWAFTRALRQTRSQVIALGGKVICAYYHSNSGGHTSDTKNVFEKARENIKGVKDPFSLGAPNSIWRLKLNAKTLCWRLKRRHKEIGKIFSILPKERDKSGRVTKIEIEHENGKSIIDGYEFRRCLGYRNLKSTMFKVYPKNCYTYRYTKKIKTSRMKYISHYQKRISNLKKVPAFYVFTGSGWGHGVGLSQWGSMKMAKQGYNYRQILSYYYPGTSLYIVKGKK